MAMENLSRKITLKDNYGNSRKVREQYPINTDQSTHVQTDNDII